MLFLQIVLENLGDWCHVSTSHDWKTAMARFEHEGISFFTITLPSFGKDFLRGLEQGYVDHTMFPSFGKQGGTPRFLGGFLDLVFDRCSGRLIDIPSVEAIRSVIQFSLMAEKMYLECSPERVKHALQKYINCENELTEKANFDSRALREFAHMSNLLFGEVFYKVELDVIARNLTPKHGPGVTADRLLGNKKYEQREWPWRLEEYYPSVDFLLPNESFYDLLEEVKFIEPGAERPCKVITVPKTLKTPRIIAVEPTAMQYAQQSLLGSIKRNIRANDTVRMLIDWKSQIPNQKMALRGSRNGKLATLDLSEASDRVSNQLIVAMLARYPKFLGAAQAARSRTADVPGFGKISLAKYASMGSALCFPMESFVFMTCVFLGIQDALKRAITHEDIMFLRRSVRTYGDDIIIPSRYAEYVVRRLELYMFKVNLNKSFWNGKFRESCGKWYYAGEEVTPIRLRRMLPTHRTHAEEIISTVALRNQLYQVGLWQAVRFLDSSLERLIPFPAVLETSPGLGKISALGYQVDGWNNDLQRPFVKAAIVRGKLPSSPLDDVGALLKFFLKEGDLPIADEKHLLRAGRPRFVDIQTVKAPPF